MTADSEDRILAVRLTDLHVVRSLAVPHEPHGIEAVDLLRSALVMSNESGTVTVLDAGARGRAPGARGLLEPALRGRAIRGAGFAYVSDDAGRSGRRHRRRGAHV